MQKKILNSVLLIFLILSAFACNEKENKDTIDQPVKVEMPPEVITGFGPALDTLFRNQPEIHKHEIADNEIISTILQDEFIDYETVLKIAEVETENFDIKKIRAGKTCFFLKEKDSTTIPDYFIYEYNALSYIVFPISQPEGWFEASRPVKDSLRMIGGIIESSLWNSMINAGSGPELTMMMNDVFAWTVDFFGLQKGDYYKLIFNERFVGGESIGPEKIYAALFNSEGEEFRAFCFDEIDSEYFDQNGESMKRMFLKAPLKFSRISSGFSNSRLHPILKIRRPHHGIDYAAPIGTPVYSIGDGKVIFAGRSGGAGRMIKVKHANSYTSAYLHLRGYAKGVRAGKHVKQGEVIGYVGSSGLSTGPHLDFRMYQGGRAVNPSKVAAPPLKPVPDSLRANFNALMDKYNPMLEKIEIPRLIDIGEDSVQVVKE